MSICLALSKDVSVQDLIAFSPLTAVGVVAFSVATLFVIKTRISQMAAMIILSAIFGFVAAIIDFVRVIESPIQIHDESHLAAIVVREIILSASVALRFLFFWHVVALPARTEVARPLLPSRLNGSSFLPESEMHSGCWMRWGIVGLVLKYFLLASVFTIGVLEAVWRLEYVLDFNALTAVIWASATLEIAVTTLFTLKLLGNLLFMSPELRRGVIVDYIPILFALALSLGLALGTLIVFRFSESATGRLIQGLETYILITYTLVVAFDDVGAPSIANGPISKRARAAESFSAVSAPAAEILLPTTPNRPALRISLKNEQSSAQRIASFVYRRLSGRPDPEWSQRDVEAVASDAEGTSPVIRSGAENNFRQLGENASEASQRRWGTAL
ncbi:hypothetical protein BS47DRAFT_1001753 [Hydnum rufescens UP504]|uniref:Uncharacterized protein n=1 Tax=Hydnum rufescens UP504 TaxID=1448309 RepID=A0A9P6BBQ7_9AGAM|nr:hypothetical protein BS47DRAFT_1001753 [Hydnum rufescens UP504]